MDYSTVISLCRLCATQNIDSNSVENLSLADNQDRKILLSLVNKYLRITVTDCESLTPKFCAECIQKLHSFDTFSRRCDEVQEMFNSLSSSTAFTEGLAYNESTELNTSTDFPTDSKDFIHWHDPIDDMNEPGDEYDSSSYPSPEKNSKTSNDGKQSGAETDSFIVPPIRIKTLKQKSRNVPSNSEFPPNDSSNIYYEIPENQVNNSEPLRASARIRSKSRITDEVNGDVPDYSDEAKDEQKLFRKNPFPVFDFKCHVCQETFKNFSVLKRHCKTEHEESAFVNCVCGKQLHARTAIIEHKRKHTGTSLFKCDTCGKTFNRRSLLCLHMISHMPKDEQPFVCCKCAKRFHTASLLKKHEKVHLPEEERFLDVCDICQKRFTSKSARNAHLRAVHYGEKPFICEQCGISFSSKAILTDHLTTHSEYAPWPCEVCGRNFKSKYRLNVHMDMHRTVKYSCPHCSMELSTRRTLRMHLLVHKEEKAYVCKVCSKAFRRSKDLKNHNNLHTGRRPYKCDFCERTFANGSNCRAHKLRMHSAELGVEKNFRNYTCKPRTSTTTALAESSNAIATNASQPAVSEFELQDHQEKMILPETIKNTPVIQYPKYEYATTSQDLDFSLEYARYTAPLDLKKEVFVPPPNVNHLAPFCNDMHTDLSKMHFLYS